MPVDRTCKICGGWHHNRKGWRDSWNHNPPQNDVEELQWLLAQLDAKSKRHAMEIGGTLIRGLIDGSEPSRYLEKRVYGIETVSRPFLCLARLVLTSPTLAIRARTPAYELRQRGFM